MDKEKIQAMRRQAELKSQMQILYKSGNTEAARKIEQKLKADEEERYRK